MKRFLAITILLVATVIGSGGKTQDGELGVDAELPGKSLKWIHIAERVFARKGVNVDKFTVTVFEGDDDTITVYLTDLNQPITTRGGGGLNVVISKKTKKVIKTYYSR